MGWFLIVQFILIVPSYLLRGWVMTKLWGWYVVPYFHEAPLPLEYAIGIMMMLSFAVSHLPDPKTDPRTLTEKIGYTVFIFFALPLTFLLYGWLMQAVF